MIVARLGEALRQGGVLPQGEAPHLAVDRLQGGARHLGEALLQGVMDLLVMMAPLTGAATALLETTVLLLQGNRMIGLHPSPLASLTRAGPRWPSVNLEWFTFGPVSSL